jgi:two-component system, LytTR family, response regulator
MLRIAALDDENHALERFGSVAGEFEEIELCGLFDDADDLFAYLEHNRLDVVFLDIEMPGKSGMQLAEELCVLDPGLSVVFVTAFSQYAVEAFELSVFDYLMKPVSRERLKKTLDRISSGKQIFERSAKRVAIHCFQRFELKINEKVLPLNHLMKAKELLAFLASRTGAETSWAQITEALWPDADYERAHNNLYITTYRLRKWLSENNITQIFESARNSYRIVPSEFSCDLFDLEKAINEGDRKKVRLLYKGEFLEEDGYEWAYPIQAEWEKKVNHPGRSSQ